MSTMKASREEEKQGLGWVRGGQRHSEQRAELRPEPPSRALGPSGAPPGPFLLAEAAGDGKHGALGLGVTRAIYCPLGPRCLEPPRLQLPLFPHRQQQVRRLRKQEAPSHHRKRVCAASPPPAHCKTPTARLPQAPQRGGPAAPAARPARGLRPSPARPRAAVAGPGRPRGARGRGFGPPACLWEPGPSPRGVCSRPSGRREIRVRAQSSQRGRLSGLSSRGAPDGAPASRAAAPERATPTAPGSCLPSSPHLPHPLGRPQPFPTETVPAPGVLPLGTDLGPYLLGQLPPPAQPLPQAWPAPPPPEDPAWGAPPPRPPAPRERPGCCPAEQRGARPPATAASLQAPSESPEKAGSLTEAALWKQEEGAQPRASSPDRHRRRGLAEPGQCRPSPGEEQPHLPEHFPFPWLLEEPGPADSERERGSRPPPRTPGPRAGAAPSGGRARPRAAAAGTAAREGKRRRGPASPGPPAARAPCGAAASALAQPGRAGGPRSSHFRPPLPAAGPGPARAEVRRPPGSPTASRRKRAPCRRSPRDPAARGSPGSGRAPCDVAARWGRSGRGRSGAPRRAGRGRAGAGRGAAAGWPGPPGAPPPPPPPHGEWPPAAGPEPRTGRTLPLPLPRPDLGLSPGSQNFLGSSLSPHASCPPLRAPHPPLARPLHAAALASPFPRPL
ncbi:basic proline-rich protein-like [Moschus berezovskii]|uniref:basic proline-rich protein-like n=1 Tax=Moschus berezovskii TaxID=68408 RepID=UPI002443FD25|nr:basic proline-rich protein-like [Moschus berezovskii]